MSLKLIKKNSSSPFHLQRSIVPQGDEDGAYSKGGYNPEAVYNNDAANEAMESFSKTIGAALSNMDFGKKKPENKPATKKQEVLANDQKLDLKSQTFSNYSDYSGDNKSNEIESARSTYEKKQKKLKDTFSNFSF